MLTQTDPQVSKSATLHLSLPHVIFIVRRKGYSVSAHIMCIPISKCVGSLYIWFTALRPHRIVFYKRRYIFLISFLPTFHTQFLLWDEYITTVRSPIGRVILPGPVLCPKSVQRSTARRMNHLYYMHSITFLLLLNNNFPFIFVLLWMLSEKLWDWA